MKELLVGFLAMLPVIELRGAIPIGVSIGANTYAILILAIIGNLIPVIPIYYFAPKVLFWLKDKPYVGKICNKIIEDGEALGNKLESKLGNGIYLSIFLYIAIPIPGTGVWSATLAASLLKLDFKKVFLANLFGVVTAGLLMTVLSGSVKHIFESIM